MSQIDVIDQVLRALPFDEVEVTIDDQPDATKVALAVPEHDSGVLIGFHGETIDALELVLSLISNNGAAVYKPLELDINSYRQTRIKSLQDLAENAAAKATQSGREIILPPLSSRDRRQIHLYLSGRPDVTTYSEGVGSGRRLIVRPTL
jgi:spoIIIJ-associated protein